MHFDIPPEAFWGGLGAIALMIGTFILWFAAWRPSVLTKEEHVKICTENQADVKAAQEVVRVTAKEGLERVVKMLEEQNMTSGAFRDGQIASMDKIKNDISEMKVDVAVASTEITNMKCDIIELKSRPMVTVNTAKGG